MKNKRTSKRMMAAAFVLTGILAATQAAAAAQPSISLKAGDTATLLSGGETVAIAEAPLIQNDTIYLPLRSLLNALSPRTTDIIWNADRSIELKSSYVSSREQTIHVTIRLAIDSKEAEVTKITMENEADTNNYNINVQLHNKIELTSAPILVDSKTYIPYELFSALNRETAITDGAAIVLNQDEAMKQKVQLAQTWAEALKTRDGKPRYDMMSEALQKAFTEEHEAVYGKDHYVIGVSSPWTVSYDILLQDDAAYITYYQTDSTGERTSMDEIIHFAKQGDGYVVCADEIVGAIEG